MTSLMTNKLDFTLEMAVTPLRLKRRGELVWGDFMASYYILIVNGNVCKDGHFIPQNLLIRFLLKFGKWLEYLAKTSLEDYETHIKPIPRSPLETFNTVSASVYLH